jgi:heme/copper-type cytochrome/quinol oxidase subunit 4
MDIDPRGPRFAALVTTVVLAVVLVTGSLWLLVA